MTNFCKSRAITDPPGSSSICRPHGRRLLVLTLYLAVPATVLAMAPGMRGPRQPLEGPPAATQPVPLEASRQALMTPIRWFQSYVSPMDGPRCQFSPTCSSFGYAAVHDHGPWHGMLMTADRLLRCSYLTDPAGYPLRADGQLIDPVAGNLLED
jgi:putative membrane protein insertion efficiency factor